MGGPSPEQLQRWYDGTTLWSSLRDFANTRFLDQQVEPGITARQTTAEMS